MPTTTGFHGYGAIDFYAVDEHLGDMAKLREFVRKAHLAGFVVLQDQVVNHTGPYHPWANDPPTPNWFNGTVEKHDSNNWQKWTAMNPRATYQTQRRNIDGWFIDILPDLNQNNPEVEKYLIQNSLWWLAQAGFDSIRMDTLPHVPRSFWAKWGAAVHREFPKVNILGELYDSDPVLLSSSRKAAGLGRARPRDRHALRLRAFLPDSKRLRRASRSARFTRCCPRLIYPRADVLVTFSAPRYAAVHERTRCDDDRAEARTNADNDLPRNAAALLRRRDRDARRSRPGQPA